MTDARGLIAPLHERNMAATLYPGVVTIEESQADVPALLDVVEAVLALHQPVVKGGRQFGCRNCDWEQAGNEDWPCVTVKAVTDALGGAR